MATSVNDGTTVTTGIDVKTGFTYTTGVSKEGLKNKDFIQLMLTELKLQDPTKAVDSSSMMEKQLQLSTMSANTKTIEAMEALTAGLEQSTLADASSLIGRLVEFGKTDEDGNPKQYKVSSVERKSGDITLTVYEISGYFDEYAIGEVETKDAPLGSEGDDDYFMIVDGKGEEHKIATKGKTYEELAEEINAISGVTATMTETSEGKYSLSVLVEDAGSSISSSGFDLKYSQRNITTYADEAEVLPYSSVSKVY